MEIREFLAAVQGLGSSECQPFSLIGLACSVLDRGVEETVGWIYRHTSEASAKSIITLFCHTSHRRTW